MDDLILSKTRNGYEVFPEIILDARTGICTISGDSYVQNSKSFYKPVLEWVDRFISIPGKSLHLICKLKSFNTGTSRVLFELLQKLNFYKQKGGDVKVEWFVDEQNDTIADDIVDVISEFEISLKLRSYN
jgi:hypothetical protein